jgi:hypothetical protein
MWDKVGYNVGRNGEKWGKVGTEQVFYTLKWGKMTHHP